MKSRPDIDAAIAAVREVVDARESAREEIELLAPEVEDWCDGMRAALAILEAAQAWAADVSKHGLRQQLRQGAATTAIELLQAIRGETP